MRHHKRKNLDDKIHEAVPTSFAHNFGHIIGESWKEGSGKHGLGGLQFFFEAVVNPFYLPNTLLEARHDAKANRRLRELERMYAELVKLYPHLGSMSLLADKLQHNGRLRDFYRDTSTNDLGGIMGRRLQRMRSGRTKDVDREDGLKNFGVTARLNEKQIEEFLRVIEERNELIGKSSELRSRSLSVKTQDEAQELASEMNAYLQRLENLKNFLNSNRGSIVFQGIAEANAMYKAEVPK